MPDGWFPVLSPSGRRVLRGSVRLSLDGAEVPDQPQGGIAGAWADEDTILYRTHETGEVRRRSLVTGEDVRIAGPSSWVAAGGGVIAWCETPRDAPVRICTADGRRWDGYGGGWAPVHVARDGTIFCGAHDGSGLYVVFPGEDTPTLIDPAGGRLVRSCTRGIVYERDARVYYADWATLQPRDVTLPGESEFGPVVVDTPEGPWLMTHTHTRLLARPLGSMAGVVVDESGDTFYPDAAWVQDGLRIVWSSGAGATAGTPHEAWVALSAPRVDLAAPPVWHPVGTEVNTMPFLVPSYTGTLRCPADGQTLQTVRTGPKEVCCVKGSPERQERWTWDDEAVYLTYDASDGRAQPWRVTPTPVWARRVSFVGDSQVYGGTRLVRRTATGGSEAHSFPLRTSVYAYGEHILIAGIGRCRILSTTWEPGWPDSGYEERHWWAIRESDGLRLGRVRYEEWRRGVLERSFDFSELLPDQRLEPAPMLHIPDPPAPIPDPAPTPEPMPQTIQPPPRDEILRCLTWLRDEVYPGLVGHPIDDEGIAAWLVDTYTVDARLRRGLSHEAAMHHTFAAIERTVHPPVTPDPAPDPPVTPPASGGLVGPLRIG